jgi:hypothetical protein
MIDVGERTSIGFVRTRLIRHTLSFQSLTQISLAIAMIVTAFRCPLMFAVGLAVTLCTRVIAAVRAAVAMPAEARTADPKHRPAPTALSPKESDAPAPDLRHRARKPGLDSDP